MAELGDVTFALRMRDALAKIVREILGTERPPDRFGRVVDINRFTGTASVLLNGDSTPVRCRITTAVQPVFVDTTDGDGKGQMVRVSGRDGAYWVTQIISGNEESVRPHLFHPRLKGGPFFNSQTANYDTVQGGLPAIGSTWHFGRWENSSSFGGKGIVYLEIVLKWTFFTGNIKAYQVAIRNGATGPTGSAAWTKLAPVADSGDRNGNDFELEILADEDGFELRARRMNFFGGGFTPGGMSVAVWCHGDAFGYVDGSELKEEASAVPTKFFGVDSANRQTGPFLSPGMMTPIAAQDSLMGARDITWDGVNTTWADPFLINGLGRNQYFPLGLLSVNAPGAGVTVPVIGSSTRSSVTTVAGGIPLTDGDALYWEPDWGNGGSITDRFFIVNNTDAGRYFSVPSHWIMLAAVTSGRFVCFSRDDTSPRVFITQGGAQTGWTSATFNAITFGSPDVLDTHDMHNPSGPQTRVIIGKRLGWYRVSGSYHAASNTATAQIRAAIAKNGTRLAGSEDVRNQSIPASSGFSSAQTPAVMVQATTATDYVELLGYQIAASGTIGTNIASPDLISSLTVEFMRP